MGRVTNLTRLSSEVDRVLRQLQRDFRMSRVEILDGIFFDTPAVQEFKRRRTTKAAR